QGRARARQAGRYRHHHGADPGPQGADAAARGHSCGNEAGLGGHRPGGRPRRQLPADRGGSGGGQAWRDHRRPHQPGRTGAGGCFRALRTQPAGLPQARDRQGRPVPAQPRRRHRRGLPDVQRRRSRAQERLRSRDMDLISDGIYNLIIFVLAIYVGYHVVWNVTPALHTPLMAVTNAISAIVIVGAMLAAALTVTPLGKAMGTLAVALAAVNVFGGFLVTRRMLEMFKKKAPNAK